MNTWIYNIWVCKFWLDTFLSWFDTFLSVYTNFFFSAPNYWRIISTYVISLKSICREFVARFAVNFQFPILIVLDRNLFYIFDTCTTFLRLFRDIIYPRSRIQTCGGKRLSRVSRSPSNVISTFPIAVAYFRICFQFPFGKSCIKTADRHVNSMQLFRADST